MSSSSVFTSSAHVALTPVRYEPQFEQPEKDELETEQALNETLHKIQETVCVDSGHARRAVHAKSHGILRGELRIPSGLPAIFAQGLFALPGTYPLVMRFSTIPGDLLDDSVSTPRGLAIKIVGVEGTRLPGSEGDVTQDFVLVNGPAFVKPSVKSFERSLKLLAATTDKAQGLKKVVSAALRGVEHLVEALGGESATLVTMGGQQQTHLLGDTYFSQAPILFGDYMAKISLAPASEQLRALTKAPLDLTDKPNALREAVIDFFREHAAEWDLRVQLCTDIEAMPIEDASKVWSEEQSPYVSVGRIVVQPQAAWSPTRVHAVDEGMSFSPWHGLAAHRPIGSVMRARKLAYERARQFRAERNRQAIEEPRNLEQLPD